MAIQNKEKGFTLIEVLIAAVILCAIFPLTNYFLNSMRTNNTTEVQQTANYLCQKYMEDYKAKSKEELNPGTYNFDEEGLHITVQIERDTPEDEVDSITFNQRFCECQEILTLVHEGHESDTFTVGDEVLMKIHDRAGKVMVSFLKGNSTLKEIQLSNDGNRLIIYTRNDPQLTINVKNSLPVDGSGAQPKFYVYDLSEPNKNRFKIKKATDPGEVEISKDPPYLSQIAGATIKVLVSDDKGNVLAKAGQTRKIGF
ncbi:MAG: type IV pilus modification PilV family protein [Peptococcia bacterium]|jgi:prepilin-type N-terminal cleavage/methylation domain-containing protein